MSSWGSRYPALPTSEAVKQREGWDDGVLEFQVPGQSHPDLDIRAPKLTAVMECGEVEPR